MSHPAEVQPSAVNDVGDKGYVPELEEQQGPDSVSESELSHDGDSGFFDVASEDWKSLESSIVRYRHQYGRTYHSYKEGKYNVPNDLQERERLDLQNHLFLLTLEGSLYRAPLPNQIHNCLDVGTGTGLWAIDFAEEHPEAKVIGTDLSPIQPTWVPPNIEFIIDDAEEPWEFRQKFDFVHSRQMVGSFADWPKFLEFAHSAMKPGAYIELQDIGQLVSDDGRDYSATGIMAWYRNVARAFEVAGRGVQVGELHAARLRAAGFEDVHDELYKWPLTPWPDDPRLKELGLWSRENMLDCLEAWAIVPFTRFLGWSLEEVRESLGRARVDLKDPGMEIRASWNIHVVYGRKPINTTLAGGTS